MRKLLSRILAVAVVISAVLVPVSAQHAKKAITSSPKASALTMKVNAASVKKKESKMLQKLPRKKSSQKGFGKFMQAMPMGVGLHMPNLRFKGIAKEASNLPDLYGVIVYSDLIYDDDDPLSGGLYRLPLNSTSRGELLADANSDAYAGVCVGNTYYNVGYYFDYYSYSYVIFAEEIDLDSYEITNTWTASSFSALAVAMAYDTTTSTIYAITYDDNGEALQLSTMTFGSEGPVATKIADLDGLWNSLMVDASGQLYGIECFYDDNGDSTGSNLCKIDKATGAVTEIGSTGCYPQYSTSACIDPATGRCFWNLNPADNSGYMCEVDLTTGAATILYQLLGNDEVMGMYVGAAPAGDTPAQCENMAAHFEGTSLSGTVTMTAPATLYDGTAGSGALAVTLYCNGQELETKENVEWGSELTFTVTVEEAGLYEFSAKASTEAGDSRLTRIDKMWIGADTPAATTATLTYANGNMEVSWLAVTESVNGGYINPDNVTYTVKDMEGNVKAEGLTVLSWSEAVGEPEELTVYQYTVQAVHEGLASAAATTNSVVLGSIVPPYTSNYTQDGLNGWTIIDGNGDANVWTIYGDALRVKYNSEQAMDDWAITLPIKLEAGKIYNFSVNARAGLDSYPERIEIKYGRSNTVEGMTETLVASTDIASKDNVELSGILVPKETGIYYIGFHGISDANAYYLYIGNYTIEAGTSGAAPAAGKLTATADNAGGKEVAISYTAPTKTLGDDELASIQKVELYRGSTLINTWTSVAPGQTVTYDDTVTEDGTVSYSAVAYNESGNGAKAVASTMVGFDMPSPVPSATISRTATEGEALVTWEAVTTDVNGKTYPEGSVKYGIYNYTSIGWTAIAEDLTGISYSWQAVEAGQQDFVQVAVFAFYDDAQGEGAATSMIPVGTPYTEVDETFPDGSLKYIWAASQEATENGAGGASVGIFTDEEVEGIVSTDNGYLYTNSNSLNGSAMVFSGMISLDGMNNPGITLSTYNIAEDDTNEINVYVKPIDSNEWTRIYNSSVTDIAGGEEEVWGVATIELSEYAGKTVQIGIETVVKAYIYTFIDEIKVSDLLDYDLKAKSITAPASVAPGETYSVDVQVENVGVEDATNFSVELYKDGELAETKAVEELTSGSIDTIIFEQTLSAIATEPVSYYAKVVYEADENQTNNATEEVTVKPKVSKLPAVTDLAGEESDGNVVLTWTQPDTESGVDSPVTEDFEDATAFSAEYGDWTFVDVDGSAIGGFQNLDIPGITSGTTKGSFWIWDQSQVGNDTFKAHSGSKYLFALYRYDGGTNNDWAISPKLSGNAQTISFYAKSYSGSYPEKLEVAYTTADSVDPADYSVIASATVEKVPDEWTLYEVELPADTQHFAIVCGSTDKFMLMVDDVTYIPDGSKANVELEGYNVYRNGEKINSELVADATYTDENVVADEEYSYVVTAVYTTGESAPSNVFSLKMSGIGMLSRGATSIMPAEKSIVVLNAEGMNVTITSADGAIIYNGDGAARSVIRSGAGVYVVKAGKTVRKVVVR